MVGDTEDAARLLADCRTAKFLQSIIEATFLPEEDDSTDAKMQVDDGDLASERSPSTPDWSCEIRIRDFIEDTTMYDFRVDVIWQQETFPSPAEFPSRDVVVTQIDKVRMEKLESDLKNLHESVVTFFSIESAHEQWKLVRQVAAYGHKSRARAFALKLAVSPPTRYDVYLIPPGASINSTENLYWPKSCLPRSLSDRKQIYGFLRVRHL